MPKPSLPFPEEPIEDAPFEDASLDGEPDPIDEEPAGRGPGLRDHASSLKIAAAVAVVLVLGGALMAYRAHNRRAALRAGLARAEQLLRLDTAAGYQDAAALLEPLAELDPLDAASARAFALAMLFADYRVGRAEADAEALLVRPGRAAEIPRMASLAQAALGLGRRHLGDATAAASAAQGSRWAEVLQARIALAAGALPAAAGPAASAASSGGLAAGLAVHGDVLRRGRRDAAAARAAYAAALAASPLHPRAAYGLAKLALAGDAPFLQGAAPLERLLADASTPAHERGRAALHLAALRLQAGDRPGAEVALDAAHLDPSARAWAGRAAAVAAGRRAPYLAVAGAPTALQSASDDDPPELSATPAREVTPPRPAPAAKPAALKKAAALRAPARKPAAKASATSRRTAGSKQAAATRKATAKRTAR
jgi:hypothetical protein